MQSTFSFPSPSELQVGPNGIESLDGIERERFAGLTLEMLLEVAELNFESVAALNSFRPGLNLGVDKRCYHRTVYFVWRGLFKQECESSACFTSSFQPGYVKL
jgi:hypothetical protein